MLNGKITNLIDTFKPYPAKFLELSLDVIETDPNQPRKAFGLGVGGDYNHLLMSISCYGIEDPIKVSELGEGRFIIMDGHRRLACAKELNLKKVPCRIYPKMSEGELEARRYEMQNNRRDWRPIEKANSIHKIKTEYSNATEKQIADLIGIRHTTLLHFVKLRDMRMEYLELMAENNLNESQRVGFIKLLPTLRKIRQYQVDDIVKIIFEKIKNNLLYRRKDFTALRKIFVTASINDEELFHFLSTPEVSVSELNERTLLSGLSSQIRFLIKDLSIKKNLNIKLTEKEQAVFSDLYRIMESFV